MPVWCAINSYPIRHPVLPKIRAGSATSSSSWAGLVHHRETPAYEVDFVAAHPRGGVSEELGGVLPRLGR